MLLNNSCPVCRSSSVYDVTDALEAGESSAVIAERFGLNAEAVEAHLAHLMESHVPKAEHSDKQTILEGLRRSAARLEQAVLEALQDNDRTLFIRCSAELNKCLALQHQIAAGVTDNPHTESAIHIRSLARKLISALPDSPVARKLMSDALRADSDDADEVERADDDRYAEYL